MKTRIIMIEESWTLSAARDLTTAGVFLVVGGLGRLLGEEALGWIAVFVGAIILAGLAKRLTGLGEKNHMTPDEARMWLDENFPQVEETE